MLQVRVLGPVSRSSDTAIVLANRLVETDPDPEPEAAWNLRNVAHVLDYSPAGVLTRNSTSPAHGDAALLDLLLQGRQLSLFMARGVRVEAAEFLSLLPREDRVGLF